MAREVVIPSRDVYASISSPDKKDIELVPLGVLEPEAIIPDSR